MDCCLSILPFQVVLLRISNFSCPRYKFDRQFSIKTFFNHNFKWPRLWTRKNIKNEVTLKSSSNLLKIILVVVYKSYNLCCYCFYYKLHSFMTSDDIPLVLIITLLFNICGIYCTFSWTPLEKDFFGIPLLEAIPPGISSQPWSNHDSQHLFTALVFCQSKWHFLRISNFSCPRYKFDRQFYIKTFF